MRIEVRKLINRKITLNRMQDLPFLEKEKAYLEKFKKMQKIQFVTT